MNLVSLEYFITNKTQNMDLNALLSKKIETIFFAMTRCSLPYIECIPEAFLGNPGVEQTLPITHPTTDIKINADIWLCQL